MDNELGPQLVNIAQVAPVRRPNANAPGGGKKSNLAIVCLALRALPQAPKAKANLKLAALTSQALNLSENRGTVYGTSQPRNENSQGKRGIEFSQVVTRMLPILKIL